MYWANGLNLITRYKEHIRNIRFNEDESAFAQHNKVTNTYGTNYGLMEYARKGNIMNIKENSYS
jgi:hypothetical protein